MATFALGALFAAAGFAPPGENGNPLGGFTVPGAAAPAGNAFDSSSKVNLSAIASQARVAPGGDLAVAIVLNHQPGWHSWTNAGNVPTGMVTFDGAIHTEIKPSPRTSASIAVHASFIQWPEVHSATADVGDGPKPYAVFSEKAVAFVPITVKPGAPLGTATLEFLVTFQTCDASQCLAPAEDVPVSATIEVVDAATLAASGGNAPPSGAPVDFTKFDASVFARIHGGESTSTDPSSPTTSDGAAATTGGNAPSTAQTTSGPAFFGIELPRAEGAVGILLLVVLSLIGGFILNLTPCVLPIIPIKILTISQHAAAGHSGKTLWLGLWMAFGVVAFWAGIGIPAALFTAAADPSRLFGIWWLTLAIGLLIGAMGVGIMGLFTIQLPASAYAINPKADTAWGSFLFGVMTGVLGLPCFGFVAGALLAGSAALPPAVIMTIFTSLGVGMAAPYLVLSAKPALVNRIPRTGPASELVKQVMGLLLLAAAAYFVGSGLIALVSDEPYLARQLHWWAAAVLAVVAGGWLTLRTFQITPAVAPRVVFAAIGVILGGVAVLYALDSTAKAREIWLAQQASENAAPGSYLAGVWNRYTPASFEKARADGKIVVLDFTAEWCLTCKVLKAQVLNPDPVKSALKKDDVVPFTVDLTSMKDPGWEFLRSLGRTGIPTLAVYSPGDDKPWTANAYTADQVLAALDAAREKRMAAR